MSIPGRPGHNASFFPDEGAAQSIGNRDALALWAAVRKAAGENAKEEEGSPPAAPPWKVAAGVAAAAAAIAAIARTLASRRAKKPSRPPQCGYVLQLSAKVVEVEWGKPASLTVTAWRVDERGGHTLASDVPITISTPDSALVIEPRSGTGTLTCQLSLDGQPRARTVELEVTAEGGGRTITATATAKVGFGVEVAVRFEPAAGRTHKGITFERPNQLAADGEDVLKAVIYVRVKGKVPEEVTRSKIRPSIDPGDGDFELRIDPTFDEPDKVRVLITSRRAMLHTADPAPKVALTIAATTVTRGGYDVDLPPVTVPLDPQRVYLKLWVVPGGARHTSEARCYACLAPDSSAALASFPLMLKVEALGSGHLTIDGPARVETTATGVAGWLLRYSGLTWENYLNARFRVRCGPAKGQTAPTHGTQVEIDVGANVTHLVEAIYDQQETPLLRLNNGAFTPSMLDFALPDELSGTYTNIRSLVTSDWDDYICGSYSARIFEWMAIRRFGYKDTADVAPFATMNGVEFTEYRIWHLGPVTHHFAGFHLAGTDPLESPRLIDPWWRQNWRNPAYRHVAGLYTMNQERVLIGLTVTMLTPIAMAVAHAAVASGLVTTASVALWLPRFAAGVFPVTAVADVARGVYENDTHNFNSAGLYVRYYADWIKRAVNHLRTTHPTVPAVEHVHAW